MSGLWLPYKPCTIADLINRRLLATGSVVSAQRGHFADYNGHHVRVWFNEYRRYWIAEYIWGGREVVARGSFRQCVHAAAEFHRTQGAMGCVTVGGEISDEDREFCASLGMEPYSDEIASARIRAMFGWKFDQVGTAIWLGQHCGSAATSFLVRCETQEEYEAKLAEERKAHGRGGMFSGPEAV